MLQAFPLDALFGGRPTSHRRIGRSSAGATRGRPLAAERLETRTMFNADDGQVGSSAPPPAPLDPPVQAPAAVTPSPQPITININVSISINLPETAPATPAAPAVVPPALPLGTPAEPSTGPRRPGPRSYVERFEETLMNPPRSYRDVTIDIVPPRVTGFSLGTIVDYGKWLAELGALGIANAIDIRNSLHPPLPRFPFGSP